MSQSVKKSVVWIYLPGESKPVPCGMLHWAGGQAAFGYLKSYANRKGAVSIDPQEPQLSLNAESPQKYRFPPSGRMFFGVFSDLVPRGWSRKVIDARLKTGGFDDFDYLTLPSAERSGALDFSSGVDTPPVVCVDQGALRSALDVRDALRGFVDVLF